MDKAKRVEIDNMKESLRHVIRHRKSLEKRARQAVQQEQLLIQRIKDAERDQLKFDFDTQALPGTGGVVGAEADTQPSVDFQGDH